MNIYEKLMQYSENLSVLYAEDEEDARGQVSQILKLFFKEVHVAENGKEALAIYMQNGVDLIMTDLTMPKMDGISLIKNIKEINNLQAIVVLTAHNSSENLLETIDLQIDGFLIKPIKMDRMLELLTKLTYIINRQFKS